MAQTFPFLGSKGRAAFAALLHDESPHVWIIGDSSRPRARATPVHFTIASTVRQFLAANCAILRNAARIGNDQNTSRQQCCASL